MRINRENQRMKLKNKKRPIRKSWMNNDQRFMIFPFKITKTNTNPNTNTNTTQKIQIYNFTIQNHKHKHSDL